MASFIHSVLESDALVAASGDEVFDLPVNPLSVILVHIAPLNETVAPATYSYLEALLGAVVNLRVTHKGNALVDARGVDLAVKAMIYNMVPIWQSNAILTDNVRRSVVLPIIFGRSAYNPKECLPKTTRGELQMTINWLIAAAGFDGLRRSIETIELPDATPEVFEKFTTLVQTFAATGQNEIDLPIGNVLRAILGFGTTGSAGAAPVPTLGAMQVLRNNQQVGYTNTAFEIARGVAGLRGAAFPLAQVHTHSFPDTAGVVEAVTREIQPGASIDDNYVLLDFDPTKDDLYSLDTKGASRVHLRVDADTANAARIMPIERVAASLLTS
jgi:hypothetical protein